jgi:hypothetical protein
MKKILRTPSGDVFGPFNSVLQQPTAYVCDGFVFPYNVIGTDVLVEDVADDWQRPKEPASSEPTETSS